MLWYTGNDIRRMEQACVPVITKLDAYQPVSQAIEVDWVNGSTSTRGLEFGTKEGQERMRATRQHLRLVLEEQARLLLVNEQDPAVEEEKKDNAINNEEKKMELIAATSLQASQLSTERALQVAVQDADFVCSYIENVHHSSFASHRHQSSGPLAIFVWKLLRAAQRKWLLRKVNHQISTTITKGCNGRGRCDTESTATLMAQSS
jgi:hypothetical protein